MSNLYLQELLSKTFTFLLCLALPNELALRKLVTAIPQPLKSHAEPMETLLPNLD